MKFSRTGSGRSSKIARGKSKPLILSKYGRHSSTEGWRGRAKRLFDVMAAGAGLIALSPLMALAAILIRLYDGGPVLYRQTRVGLGNRHFTIVKFRTMTDGAENHLGAIWSVPNDPRCTPLGAWLRRLGIDELPQLLNVIRGEMSLVGPRPERPEFTREFRREHNGYDLRHSARPGITGFAQAYGWRGYTSLEERLRHDLYYIRNWSLALDGWIIVLTVIRGWRETTRRSGRTL